MYSTIAWLGQKTGNDGTVSDPCRARLTPLMADICGSDFGTPVRRAYYQRHGQCLDPETGFSRSSFWFFGALDLGLVADSRASAA